MENNKIVKLSDAVSKLLDEDNKDKSLEVSEELNTYLIEIKELVEVTKLIMILSKMKSKNIFKLKNLSNLEAWHNFYRLYQDECPLHKQQKMSLSFTILKNILSSH